MYGWDRYGGTYSTRGWCPGEASGLQLVLVFAGVVLLEVLIVLDHPHSFGWRMPSEGVLFLGAIVLFFFLACVSDAHPRVGWPVLTLASLIATLLSLTGFILLWLEWRYLHHEALILLIYLIYSSIAFIPSAYYLRKAWMQPD